MSDEISVISSTSIRDGKKNVVKLNGDNSYNMQDFVRSLDIMNALASLNVDFADVSYVCGWTPTSKDVQLFDLCTSVRGRLDEWPHLKRWFINIESFTPEERLRFPAPEESVTSLSEKVECIYDFRYCENGMLGIKVRQPIAGE